nr:hypothetical protein [Trinickia terrae]
MVRHERADRVYLIAYAIVRRYSVAAVKGTSVASVVSRRLLPYELEHKILPTVTSFESLFLLRIKFTRSLGVFVGRAIPGVGWVILAADVSTIIYRSVTAYNSLAKPEDRL